MTGAIFKNPQLEGGAFFIPGNQIGLLMVHGFTATTAEVRLLADLLAPKGYTIAAPLLPGHNTTPEDLNGCQWQDWANEVRDAYAKLSSGCRQVFLCGESMGALLCLYLAAQVPDISGLILYAPAMKVPQLQYSRWISLFKPFLPKPHLDDDLLWKGYTVNPTRAAAQLFNLQGEVRRLLPKVHQPTLIFMGKMDETIALESGNMVLNGIASRDKTLQWMEKSHHCIILDQENGQVADLTHQFIISRQKKE
ncbi:MAG TPA: alpha/beta fold hydrolase [Anaerolineaceae bacterium]|nr:alpha/beta fold hydrolase [Anaerolineaceae bacterium]HPN51700.1 alpha/beta fold hydrolase [Anaerolineaceae bacterium]